MAKHYELSQEKMSSVLLELAKFLTVEPLTAELLRAALSTTWKDKEDAAQYHSALAAEADVLITRDVKHFTDARGIKVMSPKAFIAEYLEENN